MKQESTSTDQTIRGRFNADGVFEFVSGEHFQNDSSYALIAFAKYSILHERFRVMVVSQIIGPDTFTEIILNVLFGLQLTGLFDSWETSCKPSGHAMDMILKLNSTRSPEEVETMLRWTVTKAIKSIAESIQASCG